MADRLILMDSARGADCAALRAALVRVLGPAATGTPAMAPATAAAALSA